jgi:hypothetical protein
VGLVELAVGAHSFEVQATDSAGNLDATPASYTWTVVAPPQTTINGIASGSVIISFAGSSEMTEESQLIFECSLDGGDFAACSSPVTYSDLSEESHTFEVRAIDEAGNADPYPTRFTWTGNPSDCTMVGTLSAMADTWVDQNSSANNFGSDAILKVRSQGPADDFRTLVQFPLPAVPASCVIESATLRMFAAASTADRTLEALQIAGEWSEHEVTWENQPTTAGTAATTTSGTDWLEWDVISQIQAMYAAAENYGFLIRDAAEGGDGAEQQFHSHEKGENTPELVIVYAPPPPPETTIDSGPTDGTTDTIATFTFSADMADSTFECALDGAAFAGCSSPMELTGLATGVHTFEVRAVHPVGILDETPASYTWTVEAPADTTPPETTIDSGPADPTTETSASFTFSASEEGSTFECALDGEAFATCASPLDLTGLAEGAHTLEVRGLDPAGNVDDSPASYAWTIEAPPPPVDCGSAITLSADADAWIDQNSSSNNMGSDSILKIQSKSGNNFRALVRFALPAMPDGCVVQSAILRLYAASYKTGRTLQALQVSADWTESGVTWSNQPATTGAAATTSSGSGYREWNVAAQVQAMYAGANYGFLIRDKTENKDAEQQFHSREKGESMPQLVITFAPGAP